MIPVFASPVEALRNWCPYCDPCLSNLKAGAILTVIGVYAHEGCSTLRKRQLSSTTRSNRWTCASDKARQDSSAAHCRFPRIGKRDRMRSLCVSICRWKGLKLTQRHPLRREHDATYV